MEVSQTHWLWCSNCDLLQDDLLSSAVMLKEANAISVELKKQVRLVMCVRSVCTR